MSAPLTGGYQVGGDRFAVDGDFSQCDPCGLPVISFPMMGDSIFSNRTVIFFNSGVGYYTPYPLGTFPNDQPWSANQVVAVLDQEFMVAQEFYQSMRLNTPYDPSWAVGWEGVFTDGISTFALDSLILVKEGALEDMGGGICKIKRTWASIPPTRNEVEQFPYNFIGYGENTTTRQRSVINVLSRLQYDYFVFDDWGVIPGVPLFPNGPRLNASTGLYPPDLILPAQYYFSDLAGVSQNNFTDSLTNGDELNQLTTATMPPLNAIPGGITGYTDWISNGYEIVAEGSIMNRWMGNIFERRTRFVLAQ